MGYNPGAAQRIWGVIKMFYNWIVALVTGLNAFVKTKNYILRRMDFTIKTLFLNKLAKKQKQKQNPFWNRKVSRLYSVLGDSFSKTYLCFFKIFNY